MHNANVPACSTVVRSGNLKKAAELFGSCASTIYAIDDIGRRFAVNPFSPITMSEVICALTESIRATLLEADAMVPGDMVHKAHIESAGAADILQALDDFVDNITLDGELLVEKNTAGIVIYDLTVRLAKGIERAQLACGAKPWETTTSYLSGDTVDDPSRPPSKQIDAEASPAA